MAICAPIIVTDKPPRRRRWIPLSLRIFLAIMLVLATTFIGFVAVPVVRQQLALRELRKAGASIHRRFEYPEWVVDAVSKARWLGKSRLDLVSFTTEVNFSTTRPNPEINRVLVNLKGVRGLRRVNLANTEVDDSGLVHLDGLEELQELNIRETPITDAGLSHLSRLKALRRLSLLGTQVTDKGLAQLERLNNLRELTVVRTRVTAGGVEKLKAALPGLNVITHDEWDRPRASPSGWPEVPEPLPTRQ
jgi:hypothetical protein